MKSNITIVRSTVPSIPWSSKLRQNKTVWWKKISIVDMMIHWWRRRLKQVSNKRQDTKVKCRTALLVPSFFILHSSTSSLKQLSTMNHDSGSTRSALFVVLQFLSSFSALYLLVRKVGRCDRSIRAYHVQVLRQIVANPPRLDPSMLNYAEQFTSKSTPTSCSFQYRL